MKKIFIFMLIILSLSFALVSQETTNSFLDLKTLKNNEITVDNKTQAIDKNTQDKEKFHEQVKTALKNRKSVIFKDASGKIFTNGEYRFHLMPEQNANTIAFIEYQIDKNPYTTYVNPIPLEKEGIYTLTYRGVDILGSIEKPQSYVIQVDTKAPELDAKLVGEGLKANDIQYYKPGVKLQVSAKDDSSGVYAVMLNVNGEGNLPIAGEQTFTKGGDYELAVRGFDNVYNLSKKQVFSFSIDDKKPTLSIKTDPAPVMINNITFCKKDSFVAIFASDNESGLAKVEYSLNAPGSWAEYKPNTIKVPEVDTFKIYGRAFDVSGNVSDVVELSCRVDFKAPTSKHTVNKPAVVLP
jgi:hypothetical protein